MLQLILTVHNYYILYLNQYFEYNFLHLWFQKTRHQMSHKEQTKILNIYNRVFNTKYKASSCGGCIKWKVQDLNKLYLEYNPKQNDNDII